MKRSVLIIVALGLFLFAQAAQADWTPAKRLTWRALDSTDPDVAVDSSGHVHVVWSEVTPGDPEIYSKRSTDGGTTWGVRERLSWNSGYSCHPAIDSNTVIHVVWDDNTTGNYEIYYKKGN